jgi:DNA-binding IclR family transcriptional regulator
LKTIKKALDVLEVFLNKKNEASISELSEITGHHPATIHGILQEFAERGYIRQRDKRGKYSLGLGFLNFSTAINRIASIEDIFHPFLIELSHEVNETVNICVKNGNSVFSVSIVQPTQKIRVVIDEKVGIPMYSIGAGKIFLAEMTDEEFENYCRSEKMVPFTPKTITDPRKIKKQIQKFRKEGVAFDFEEYNIDLRNVSAPVWDYNGKLVAAIGVLGPAGRLTRKRMKEIVPIIKKCALDISGAMGYGKSKQTNGNAPD